MELQVYQQPTDEQIRALVVEAQRRGLISQSGIGNGQVLQQVAIQPSGKIIRGGLQEYYRESEGAVEASFSVGPLPLATTIIFGNGPEIVGAAVAGLFSAPSNLIVADPALITAGFSAPYPAHVIANAVSFPTLESQAIYQAICSNFRDFAFKWGRLQIASDLPTISGRFFRSIYFRNNGIGVIDQLAASSTLTQGTFQKDIGAWYESIQFSKDIVWVLNMLAGETLSFTFDTYYSGAK